jgi:eukaryotic-like serine/threonine-protein kinase
MQPDRWREVDRIFAAAHLLEPDRRRALLDRECAHDPALRREVEALLEHDRDDGFLESNVAGVAARLAGAGTAASLVGRSIGRFEVQAPLGAGGMGEVYRARDTRLDRPVALKVVASSLRDDPERARRFRREALATSALNHPNIVTVHEILELDGHEVLVTELVDGETLHERLLAGALPVPEALDIAVQVAHGLAAAHAVGIVHRDVKPRNVMVRHDGLVKLLDFGIAKSPSTASRDGETGPGEILGTVAYMSPEQARGLPVDARTDVWSLGVILYQMVTGEAPFSGRSATDTLAAILTHDPEPPSRTRPELPEELDRLIARTLAKDRELRPADAAALALELERVRQGLGVSGSSGVDLRHAGPHRSWRRHPGWSAAVGLALAAALLAGGVAYLRSTAPSPIDSIAVLPLRNTGDSSVDYLSDGLTESVIQSLGQTGDLRVMSRAASFRYRGREVDAGDVARELGVRGILTGRMTARDDGLVLNLELIDGRDDSHAWGARYEVPMVELASLHERIARDLGRSLRRGSASDPESGGRRHTDDARAYQLYLQGRFHWHRPLPADYHRARDYFLQAIEVDPDYALAWAGLAQYYGRGAAMGLLPPDEYWPRSQQAAQRALELDPTLPEAQTSAASSALYWRRDWVEGERLMRRAVELFPEAAGHLSLYLSLTGRVAEAQELQSRADEYDPNPVRANRLPAISAFYSGRWEQVIEQARRTLAVDGTDVPSWEFLGDTLHLLGRHQEAVEAWRQGLLLEGMTDLARDVESALAESGPDAAVATLGRGRLEALRVRMARGEYVPAFLLARHALRAGERAAALDWAVRALDERNRLALDILNDPVFDPLRDEPRFVEGVRRLELPFEVGAAPQGAAP